MSKPENQNPSTEGQGASGNATGKDLFPGKLKDTTWKVLVGVIIAILAIAILATIL